MVDWDQDGDLDMWVSNRNAPRLRFFRNQLSQQAKYVALRLEGNGTTTNRDGIGARVEIHAADLGETRLVQTLRAGEGFLAQSSKWMHFGLGNLDHIDRVTVRWPGGEVEEFSDLAVDGRYVLVQGKGQGIPVPARQIPTGLGPQKQETPDGTDQARIPLAIRLPMPKETAYRQFDEMKSQPVISGTDPVLIVLWASWCLPCRQELNDLKQRWSELESAGVRVVGLAVDGLGSDAGDPRQAQRFAAKLDAPFPMGPADSNFLQLVTGYHHNLIAMTKPLPIPTSLLVDGKGRLAVIYKGRVEVDDVLRDAQSNPATARQRWQLAAHLPGRLLDQPQIFESQLQMEAQTRRDVADAFLKQKLYADARAHLDAALSVRPDFLSARRLYGYTFEAAGDLRAAADSYEQAVREFPRDPQLRYMLANAWLQLGRTEESVEQYRQAIEFNAQFPAAYVNLSQALLRLNRTEDARTALEQALAIDAGFQPAIDQLRGLPGSKP